MAKLTYDQIRDLIDNADCTIHECINFLDDNLSLAPDWAKVKFIPSVIRQARSKGAGQLSEAQKAWMFLFVRDIKNPPKVEPLPTIKLSRLANLFDGAAEKLKHPKINFKFSVSEHLRRENKKKLGQDFKGIQTLTKTQASLMVRLFANDFNLRMYRAGPRSKYEGCVQVTAMDNWRLWYGRILPDGTFVMGPNCTDDVREFLKAYNASPEKISKFFGWNSGQCCYCNKTLTDKRSLNVGYGKVCATNYSMPWGKA